MLTTRSFIKSLIVGSVAPTIFIPCFESVKWKRLAPGIHPNEIIRVENPAWKTAPYEIAFGSVGTIDETVFTQFYRDYLKICVRDSRILKLV